MGHVSHLTFLRSLAQSCSGPDVSPSIMFQLTLGLPEKKDYTLRYSSGTASENRLAWGKLTQSEIAPTDAVDVALFC